MNVPAISDSSAFRDGERVLVQHQAALTLLQDRLSMPGVQRVRWLDLACGRGQILTSLDEQLSATARAKIHYRGYDLDQHYARETRRTAERMGFASLDTHVGDLSDFSRILPEDMLFDFITLTNTIHEVYPTRLSTLLVDSSGRLTDTGTLFVYDMEVITPPELGAVPWSRDDVRHIVRAMLEALGAEAYQPEVGRWRHKSCCGWNVQLNREHFNVTRDDARRRHDAALVGVDAAVERILRRRIAECRNSLESLTVCGPGTPEEQGARERFLHEFWALSRALEHYR